MVGQLLPDLLNEIICKILQLVGEESFYYLGDFLWAGKRGYALVHEPFVLKMCNVTDMVSFVTSQISNGGQFREFFLKCVNVGNTSAICYEGLQAATITGLGESIKVLEPNVPKHGLSTFDVAIFNVCIGRDKEASQVFQLFADHHADQRSKAVLDMGELIEWLLTSFNTPFLNTYGSDFNFPDDDVIMQPKCLHRDNCRNFYVRVDGSCENCKLFCICWNVCQML
ncbi:hypothetical protein Bca4012_063545 [Brassica carinata]